MNLSMSKVAKKKRGRVYWICITVVCFRTTANTKQERMDKLEEENFVSPTFCQSPVLVVCNV